MKGISNLCFADDIGMINVFIAFFFLLLLADNVHDAWKILWLQNLCQVYKVCVCQQMLRI